MKNKIIAIQSDGYKLLLQGFTAWLKLLNYSPLSIPSIQAGLKHFLYYQEQKGKTTLATLTANDGNEFINYLQENTGNGNSTINKNIQALKLFSKYIRATGKSQIGFAIALKKVAKTNPTWLTEAEITKIYAAIPNSILGIRDAAMLALYYGCGLRLNEGKNIQLQDIDYTQKLVHVKKGKGYKERFVPIATKSFEAITLYIEKGRPQLVQENNPNNYLFIGANTGKPMDKQSLYIRLKLLIKKANLKQKIGTHTLRHSIATHLLQSGMKLEKIQQFLGHSHLDSTQIYTHIVNENGSNNLYQT